MENIRKQCFYGVFLVLILPAIQAQNLRSTVVAFTSATTNTLIFEHPTSLVPSEKNSSKDIGIAVGFGGSFTREVFPSLFVGGTVQYLSNKTDITDARGTIVHDGFYLLAVEPDISFLLPFDIKDLSVIVGGGGGAYLGRRQYRVATASSYSINSDPSFGIHVFLRLEYRLSGFYGICAGLRYNDPFLLMTNAFYSESVFSNGTKYPLQTTPFISRLSFAGNSFFAGVGVHF
jgi:hypothetical protein